MRRRLAILVAVMSLSGGTAALPSVSPAASGPSAVAAKTCSGAFTHAIIGGREKCLHAGEYCAARYQRQYRRYGYRCVYGRLR